MTMLNAFTAIVGIMDGRPDRNGQVLSAGSIRPARDVPVTINFDDRQCVGLADVAIDGDRVLATFRLRDDIKTAGLYPSFGYTSERVVCCALLTGPNSDDRIDPLTR